MQGQPLVGLGTTALQIATILLCFLPSGSPAFLCPVKAEQIIAHCYS